MDVSLCFDTEDYTSPEHWGMDDIPKWLAEIMTEEGVTGSFLVIAQKSRCMRDRGRKDVINALRKHEVAYHTNFGSDHPTLTEALAPLSWQEGVKLAREREEPGYRDMEEIYQTKMGSLSSHGASQTPTMHCVAGRHFDRPFLYSFATSPGEEFCWYADCFQLSVEGLHISEAAYSNPARVDETLANWEKTAAELVARGRKWCCVFLAHPLMIRAKQFNDALNFADGKNRIPWRTPEMRTTAEMKVAKQQFRRVIRWLANHKDLNIRTLYDTYRKYGKRRKSISRAELAEYTGLVRQHGNIRIGFTFSPADALLAMAEGVARNSIRPSVALQPVLGPVGESIRMPDNALEWMSADPLRTLAKTLLAEHAQTGHLPSNIQLPSGSGRIGLATIYLVLSEAWLQIHEGKKPRVRTPHICHRYPGNAMQIEARFRAGWLGWPIHDIYMPMEQISRDARLQSWTYKKAMI